MSSSNEYYSTACARLPSPFFAGVCERVIEEFSCLMHKKVQIISTLLLFSAMVTMSYAQSKPTDVDPATLEKLADAVQKAKYIDHYFYFPARQDADSAAQRLRKRGWQLKPVRMGADGKNWLVLARQLGPVKNLADLHQELDQFAKEFHGEYDGWEVPAAPETKK